jgi:hypothetical protein
VYASDMKKIIKWYSILTDNNVEIKEKVNEEGEENNGGGGSVIDEIKNEIPVPQEESEKNSK